MLQVYIESHITEYISSDTTFLYSLDTTFAAKQAVLHVVRTIQLVLSI